ncbi:MAG: hypothetical protein ABIH92_00855 [Nanoarchaeota archaeon]
MAIRVKYDTQKQNRVTDVNKSIDATTDKTPDALLITDRDVTEKAPFVLTWITAYRELKEKLPYLKVVAGKVVEMSQAEKDAVDAEIAQKEQEEEEAAKDVTKAEKILVAKAKADRKIFNYLLGKIGESLSMTEYVQKIKDEYQKDQVNNGKITLG